MRASLAPEPVLDARARTADAFDPATVDVAIVANPPGGSLAGLPNLKLVQSLWAGVDRLLADPTLPGEVTKKVRSRLNASRRSQHPSQTNPFRFASIFGGRMLLTWLLRNFWRCILTTNSRRR